MEASSKDRQQRLDEAVDHEWLVTNLNHLKLQSCFLMNYLWKIECFLEDLFLGGQRSIILGYRRLSVKSLLVCNRLRNRMINQFVDERSRSLHAVDGILLRVVVSQTVSCPKTSPKMFADDPRLPDSC